MCLARENNTAEVGIEPPDLSLQSPTRYPLGHRATHEYGMVFMSNQWYNVSAFRVWP